MLKEEEADIKSKSFLLSTPPGEVIPKTLVDRTSSCKRAWGAFPLSDLVLGG
jgi:hypothetical protein